MVTGYLPIVPVGQLLRQEDNLHPEIPGQRKVNVRKIVCECATRYPCVCLCMCVLCMVCVHEPKFGCVCVCVSMHVFVHTCVTENKIISLF